MICPFIGGMVVRFSFLDLWHHYRF